MAKCWLCSAKKGKRYCSPLDKVICPICCAESRMVKVSCNEDCRYLGGAAYQQKRSEDKEFSELMHQVGHGQYDDIFQQPAVATVAFEIESLVRYAYLRGNMGITDTVAYGAYKTVYAMKFQGKHIEEDRLDELTKLLLEQHEVNSHNWETDMDEEMTGQVYLRLMISVKNMSGGRFGEYGYLNYLKNNFDPGLNDDGVVLEDKFGKKVTRKLT